MCLLCVYLVGFIHPVSLNCLQSIAHRAKDIYQVGFKNMFTFSKDTFSNFLCTGQDTEQQFNW
jgi:hypothetical protein